MHIMVEGLEDLLVDFRHEGGGGAKRERVLCKRRGGNVFTMTSLSLLVVNQLRGSSLRLLHWLCLSLICSWMKPVSFLRSELGHALSTGAAES